MAALVVALTAGGILSIELQQGSPFSVSFSEVGGAGPVSGASVGYTIRAPHWQVPVHVGVVEGNAVPTSGRTLDVWYDPGYVLHDSSANDLLGLEARVVADTSALGSPLHVQLVDTPDLLRLIGSAPGPMLAMIGGATAPSSLFAGPDPPLHRWLMAGGTLFWGGGPVGYWDGPLAPNGTFVNQSDGWPSQVRAVGFPLVDPGGNPRVGAWGPLTAGWATPVGEALGLSYNGAGDGANVSEVVGHGGVVLGAVAPPTNRTAASDRTSLAYVPIGRGSLFYFGGAISIPGLGNVPDADLELSDDLVLLAGTGFIPDGAGAASVDFELSGGQTASGSLTIVPGSRPVFALALVRISGNLLGLATATFGPAG